METQDATQPRIKALGKRAIIYIRSHQPPPERGKSSGQIQDDACTGFCRQYEFTVVAKLHDMGEEQDNHPAFEKLLEMCRNHETDAVVVLDLQRISRFHVMLQYFYHEMKMLGVDVYSVMAAKPLGNGTHGPVAFTASLLERSVQEALEMGLYHD